MNDLQIKQNAVVVDSSGRQVGTVDQVEGRMIRLSKGNNPSFGQHHFVSVDHVESVGDVVKLMVPFASTARH